MVDKQLVDLADRYSRRRAVIAVVAAVIFLGVQLIGSPSTTRFDWWALNAGVLLAVLATGGGVLNGRAVRALVHDELSRGHLRTGVLAGYWAAMGLALLLYLGPWFQEYDARRTIHVIVTGSVVVALFTFAALEHRAHSDG